jgi:hypothetical protein
MLRKILLVLAIIAALAAAVVNFTVIKSKIDLLTQDRNSQRTQKEDTQRALAATNKVLIATQKVLSDTKVQLADSETKRTKLAHDLDIVNNQVQDLNGKLAKTSKERDDAQDQLAAYKVTGKTPQEVLNLDKTLKNTQDNLDAVNKENTVLTHSVARLQNQINEILVQDYQVPLPANLKGKIMAVDPKWEFVVLNVGEDQGVLKDGEMLVSRNGKLVAKVVIRSVQKDRSIANIVPGWQLGDVIEGDMVIPAHPATS